VELDAVDRERAMAHGHDLAVGGGGRNLELARSTGDRERVVAAGGQLAREALEEPPPVVFDGPGLAVDELACRADLAAEGLGDRLVACLLYHLTLPTICSV
jgi:hypothetical protein